MSVPDPPSGDRGSTESGAGAELSTALGGLSVGVFTGLASFLVPSAIVPGNAPLVQPAAALVVFATMYATRAWRRKLRADVMGIICLLGVAGLVYIPTRYGVTATVGNPPTERYYLVGYERDPARAALAKRCPGIVDSDLIECAGPDAIPLLWGSSFEVIMAGFLLSYFAFVGGGASGIVLLAHSRWPGTRGRG